MNIKIALQHTVSEIFKVIQKNYPIIGNFTAPLERAKLVTFQGEMECSLEY